MQVVGSRYGYYFNKQYGRSGTVWEGRHKSSLVQTDRYLLTCYRYIELNPVTAGMVMKPEQYRWSSYRVNAWGKNSVIVPHSEYNKLGSNVEARCQAYSQLFSDHILEHDIYLIEKTSEYCHPVGNDRFRQEIEKKYSVCLGQAARGRPRKDSGSG